MLNNFVMVAQQVLTLFIFIFCGYICGKKKLIDDAGIKTCSNIVLYTATPCLIINSFIREFSKDLLGDIVLSLLLSALIQIFAIAFVHIFYRREYDDTIRIKRFAVVFSNAGYMALPLQQAVLGDMGVFLGASYIAMFNILVWTYGVWCMSKDKGSFSFKNLINPGLISVIIGLIIFIFSIPVHPVIKSSLTGLAALNTPIPMIIVGFFISQCNLKNVFTTKACYPVGALRLIVLPVISLLIMYFCGVRGDMLVSMMIAAATPTAAITTMFSVLFNADNNLSVNLVTFTTLVSIITMPIIIAVSQSLA